jgi:hypothetical protein
MRPLGRSVLMRRIATGWPDNITMEENQLVHLFVIGKLAALIHSAILVFGITWSILAQPSVQPFDWWAFTVGGETPQ